MSAPGTIASTVAGVLLVATAARDVFDALFHPEGRSTLSRGLMRSVWRAFHRLAARRSSLFPLAGPFALLVVVATWAALLATGWALIFWPHIENGFKGAQGDGFLDALSMSLVTLSTLGFGDVTPTHEWLQVVTPLEALVGFGLLTASISWLLLLYPVLLRRRALAYEVSLLMREDQDADAVFEQLEPAAIERLYAELTSRLVAAERDVVSFPVAYYFAERDPRFSLAAAAPVLLALGERGRAEGSPSGVRLRADLLVRALHDFAQTVARRFHRVRSDSTEDLLAAYARDHRVR